MASDTKSASVIDRSVMLDFVGDWGGATFHKILSWLSQEFCDRAGSKSRTRIWTIRGGGAEAIPMVHDGEVDLCIATPAQLMPAALAGEGIFARHGPMPTLRALAVLPQRDRMILIVHPRFEVSSYEDILAKKPALRIASSPDDGESFIGYIAHTVLSAHGLDQSTIEAWGGQFIPHERPQQCFAAALEGEADAVIQEAIMLPQWNELVERQGWIPIPVESRALESLATIEGRAGFPAAMIEKDHWPACRRSFQALDFSDFLLVVRDDMPDDVAALLTWCLIETRARFESQFHHIPSDKCALTYPMEPSKMAQTSIPLHRAAEKVYQSLGHHS